jgi:hypothetical protein
MGSNALERHGRIGRCCKTSRVPSRSGSDGDWKVMQALLDRSTKLTSFVNFRFMAWSFPRSVTVLDNIDAAVGDVIRSTALSADLLTKGTYVSQSELSTNRS